MWKILCITILFHLTQAQQYVEHIKVTELEIKPNNGVLEYNENSGEIKTLMYIGDNHFKNYETPLQYNYYYENDESGEGGGGSDKVCGNTYTEDRREDQRIHMAVVTILRGWNACPWLPGWTFQVRKDCEFDFYDTTNGLLITCGNNTAEITLTTPTRTEDIGSIKFTYYLTGPKCDN